MTRNVPDPTGRAYFHTVLISKRLFKAAFDLSPVWTYIFL